MKNVLLIVLCTVILFSCKHECADTNCQNGGKCISGTCECPPGYYGERCEFKDTCYFRDCQNNSNCKNGGCDCLPTFEGAKCEWANTLGKKIVRAGYIENYNLKPDTLEAKDYILYPDGVISFNLYKGNIKAGYVGCNKLGKAFSSVGNPVDAGSSKFFTNGTVSGNGKLFSFTVTEQHTFGTDVVGMYSFRVIN